MMAKVKLVLVAAMVMLCGCAGSVYRIQSENLPVDDFSLSLPYDKGDIDYLRLNDVEPPSFKISQIGARFILIDVYTMYCPHCQSSAGRVNELYRLIQGSDLADKIKMIGIGYGDSHQEVKIYREKFSVPFPLFSDLSEEITEKLGVVSTPTFIILDNRASPRILLRSKGEFFRAEEFFRAIRAKLEGLS